MLHWVVYSASVVVPSKGRLARWLFLVEAKKAHMTRIGSAPLTDHSPVFRNQLRWSLHDAHPTNPRQLGCFVSFVMQSPPGTRKRERNVGSACPAGL